ncbi:MAG TPA: Vms1/Ankzf1 family peptidyl-tRNA hydrolase, partial [Intrasporangium sp.]|nr:Vms1/Ankzf1 family peptidyl-tRNA hydrolase [Intrasporangium sp.]
AAGGWSQQRFARRRGKQADELVDAVVRHTRRILLGGDESPRQDADGLPHGLVVGGDRTLAREVLEAPALRALRGLPMRELYDLPDPKRDVLETALRRGRAYQVTLTEPDDPGSP